MIGGTREGPAWLVEVLRKVFIVKDRGVLGPEQPWRDCWELGGEAIDLALRSGSKGSSIPGFDRESDDGERSKLGQRTCSSALIRVQRLGYSASERPQM